MIRDAIALPADLTSGEYSLSIAVVGEKGDEPVVRLGIKGRANDGWYPLSKVSVAAYGQDLRTKDRAIDKRASETMPQWFGMPDDADLPSKFSIEYVRAWAGKDSPTRR